MNVLTILRHLATALIVCATLAAPPLSAKEDRDGKSKPGYSVDGRTSASVLAAKRSHEVAEEDKTGLAIFSGLIVIAVIGFFSTEFLKKK